MHHRDLCLHLRRTGVAPVCHRTQFSRIYDCASRKPRDTFHLCAGNDTRYIEVNPYTLKQADFQCSRSHMSHGPSWLLRRRRTQTASTWTFPTRTEERIENHTAVLT